MNYEDKLKNMKSKRVLLVGGPKDGEVQEIPSDYSEIHMYMMKEPLSFDPLAEPREEKTLVINKKGEKQWVGWDEREDPIESTNLRDTKEFIYDIVIVYLDRGSFIFIGVPKKKDYERDFIADSLINILSRYDTKLTEDIIKNEYKNSIIRIAVDEHDPSISIEPEFTPNTWIRMDTEEFDQAVRREYDEHYNITDEEIRDLERISEELE